MVWELSSWAFDWYCVALTCCRTVPPPQQLPLWRFEANTVELPCPPPPGWWWGIIKYSECRTYISGWDLSSEKGQLQGSYRSKLLHFLRSWYWSRWEWERERERERNVPNMWAHMRVIHKRYTSLLFEWSFVLFGGMSWNVKRPEHIQRWNSPERDLLYEP